MPYVQKAEPFDPDTPTPISLQIVRDPDRGCVVAIDQVSGVEMAVVEYAWHCPPAGFVELCIRLLPDSRQFPPNL